MLASIAIAEPTRTQYVQAARLLAATLGFDPADAIPAWLMRTTDGCGGLTLVAVEGEAVVGASYAFPARDGEWFSCGLAVAEHARGRGIARGLKLAQRRRALAAGVSVIRWTADPLNAPALRLYLSGLGARLVAYHADLHRGLRESPLADDDVEIEWRLDEEPRDGAAARTVPIAAARPRVAADMQAALAEGLVGVAVDGDPPAVRFAPAER